MPRQPSTHVDSAAAVGERLRQARLEAGLSQRDLAFEGCTGAYVSRIEAGERTPSYQVLREFARRLGVSADYLATGSDLGETMDTQLLHAELAARTGSPDEARRLYEEILRGEPAPSVAATARAGLGQITFQSGDHKEAIDDLEAALESPVLPRRQAVAVADSLGRAYVLTSRYEEALALFERFLTAARTREDTEEVIRFSVLLANTLIDRTSYTQAEEVLAGILDQARAAVDPVTRAGIYWSQSRLHLSQRRPDLAALYARKALETLEVTEHALYTSKALVLLAQLENERGNTREALELFERAAPAIAASGNDYEYGLLLLEKARALAVLGEREEAASEALGAIGLFGDSAPISAGRGYAIAASIFADINESERAIELYELAIEVLPVDDRHRVDALTALAHLFEERGDKDRAYDLLKQALQAQGPRAEAQS